MADKRTTPEAPQEAQKDAQQDAPHGLGRKKRAAPTIDLTATEMPSPQASRKPPPGIGKEAPPVTRANWIGAHISVATLAAGIVGGAVVSLVLLTLWLTGLVPVRYAVSTGTNAQGPANTKTIDALTQRVSKIEDTIAKLPSGDAGMAERLAGADNAMKSLGIALTALNHHSDDIAANVSQARERADAAANAVTELRASVQELAKNTSAGISPAELDALQKRVAALEQSAKTARDEIAKTSTTDIAARLAFSAMALRDAVMSGAPFTAALQELKALGADENALAPLSPFAATGVPAPAVLAQELRALIPAMLKASGAQAQAGGFFERLQANAGNLVRIRPVDAPPGDDSSAVLARIEIDAAKADIAVALSDLGKLTDATRAPAQAWIAKAETRQAALAAARQFVADTARALGKR